MIRRCKSLIILLCLLTVSLAAQAGTRMSAAEKALLQAGMQQHIDRGLVDGAWLSIDLASGIVSALHPVTAHPMILRLGDHFVLCSDFRDGKGNAVNVDFFMARRGKGFVVFQMVVGDRAPLKALMQAGKAEMVE